MPRLSAVIKVYLHVTSAGTVGSGGEDLLDRCSHLGGDVSAGSARVTRRRSVAACSCMQAKDFLGVQAVLVRPPRHGPGGARGERGSFAREDGNKSLTQEPRTR